LGVTYKLTMGHQYDFAKKKGPAMQGLLSDLRYEVLA